MINLDAHATTVADAMRSVDALITTQWQPHFDDDEQFVGITIDGTRYDLPHPIAELWLKYDKRGWALELIASSPLALRAEGLRAIAGVFAKEFIAGSK